MTENDSIWIWAQHYASPMAAAEAAILASANAPPVSLSSNVMLFCDGTSWRDSILAELADSCQVFDYKKCRYSGVCDGAVWSVTVR